LTEIELELKAGEETELYDLAVRLADTLPVQLDIMSKAERGFLLTADYHPLPVRAAVLQFPANATLDDAVEVVISSALCQFVENWPAMTETQHVESIHQMRVALRRLRTALAFFDRAPVPNSRSSERRPSGSRPLSRRHGIGTLSGSWSKTVRAPSLRRVRPSKRS
jgi:inorganic triphosphatase YgiF